MVSMKKRGAVYGIIGLMLCVAVYLNWGYFQTPEELTVADLQDTETSGQIYGEVTAVDSTKQETEKQDDTKEKATEDTNDYFAQARLSRQKARDEALTMLKEQAEDDESAQERMADIANDTVKEERAESRIKAKGYEDAVVYIAEDTVSVVVAAPKEGLKAEDAAKISDIVMDETGASADRIRISEAK